MKRTTFTFSVLSGLVLIAVAALIPAPEPGRRELPLALSHSVEAADVGFAVLPDGRGGTNAESVVYTPEMGFDKKRSLEAFNATVYPVLRAKRRLP